MEGERAQRAQRGLCAFFCGFSDITPTGAGVDALTNRESAQRTTLRPTNIENRGGDGGGLWLAGGLA